MDASSASLSDTEGEGPTPRQREVLDAALRLIVEAPETLTMTAVARRASCSKETLYKWFGGRDGLLTATVRWQAAKVRGRPLDGAPLDRTALVSSLEQFAADWLTVLSGPVSVALNRLAVGGGGADRPVLGAIVLANGPHAMRRRLTAMIVAGLRAGLLAATDADTAARTFFGLVVRDVQIRLLLGERLVLDEAAVAREAGEATRQFFILYGTPGKETPDIPPPRSGH